MPLLRQAGGRPRAGQPAAPARAPAAVWQGRCGGQPGVRQRGAPVRPRGLPGGCPQPRCSRLRRGPKSMAQQQACSVRQHVFSQAGLCLRHRGTERRQSTPCRNPTCPASHPSLITCPTRRSACQHQEGERGARAAGARCGGARRRRRCACRCRSARSSSGGAAARCWASCWRQGRRWWLRAAARAARAWWRRRRRARRGRGRRSGGSGRRAAAPGRLVGALPGGRLFHRVVGCGAGCCGRRLLACAACERASRGRGAGRGRQEAEPIHCRVKYAAGRCRGHPGRANAEGARGPAQ
jgi:hypothetical protein